MIFVKTKIAFLWRGEIQKITDVHGRVVVNSVGGGHVCVEMIYLCLKVVSMRTHT
jgi:hypothetical protein